MLFLCFIYNAGNEFEEVFFQTLSQNFSLEKKEKTTIVHGKKKAQKGDSYFTYYTCLLDDFTDIQYWHEEDELLEIQSKLQKPIVLCIDYYKVELIGQLMNLLIEELKTLKLLGENIFFSDENLDPLINLESFIERYEDKEMFFFWEG